MDTTLQDCSGALGEHLPPIDDQRLPRDVAGLGRGKEQNSVPDVVDGAQTLERNAGLRARNVLGALGRAAGGDTGMTLHRTGAQHATAAKRPSRRTCARSPSVATLPGRTAAGRREWKEAG